MESLERFSKFDHIPDVSGLVYEDSLLHLDIMLHVGQLTQLMTKVSSGADPRQAVPIQCNWCSIPGSFLATRHLELDLAVLGSIEYNRLFLKA